MQVRNFEPDYTKLYTASEAEYELDKLQVSWTGMVHRKDRYIACCSEC